MTKKSLKIYITKMFFILIFILSILLISLNYQNSKQLNTKIAHERIEQNTQQIRLAYLELTSPVNTLLDLLASSKLQENVASILNRNLLKSLGSALSANPIMHAIYVGYENNNFALLKPIYSQYKQEGTNVPKEASLQLDLYLKHGRELERYYFDKKYDLIYKKKLNRYFNPTQRAWFISALSNNNINLTPPYKYHSLAQYGITFSKKTENNQAVIAVDITLDSLNAFVNSLSLFRHYKNAELIIFDENKHVILQKGIIAQSFNSANINYFHNIIKKSVLNINYENNNIMPNLRTKYIENEWWSTSSILSSNDEQKLILAIAIPEKELLSDTFEAINNQIIFAIITLILGTILIFVISERIVAPLKAFTHLADKFSNLNFKATNIPHSDIKEIDDLAHSFTLLSNTIDNFLTNLTLVSSSNLDCLLQRMVEQCKKASQADVALLWAEDETNQSHIQLAAFSPKQTAAVAIDYHGLMEDIPELETSLMNNEPFLFSLQQYPLLRSNFPMQIQSVWMIPMKNRQNLYVGSIMLGFNRPPSTQEEQKVLFLHAFLGFIALIHENLTHIYAQKQLFLSLIEMLASAIDTKSPYTGAHCQRVPELSIMLAKAASNDKKYHPEFRLDEKSQEALQLAAWLHDCGKVTTPEYVIDKATKLETLYNRIHEIRTRFEVLKRDKQIEYWQKRAENKETTKELDVWLEQELRMLDDEFAFIAKINQGEYSINQQELARLEQIASRSWYRTLDDSIGLSWEEKHRLAHRVQPRLPYKEALLKNAIEQQIPWSDAQQQQFSHWPFKMQPTALQFNRGELYNLSITKGTLTDEERFIINNHIVQTINMLNKLPYPPHLARIPEIAGGHHERLNGKGYPMGLTANNFSIDARIIAIADIFEALTARDRPYKGIKTVHESLIIMANMAKEQHIDEGLLRIFIEQKIYLTYAKQFLDPFQYQYVDEEIIIAALG